MTLEVDDDNLGEGIIISSVVGGAFMTEPIQCGLDLKSRKDRVSCFPSFDAFRGADIGAWIE